MERIAIQAGKSTVGLRTPGECLCVFNRQNENVCRYTQTRSRGSTGSSSIVVIIIVSIIQQICLIYIEY